MNSSSAKENLPKYYAKKSALLIKNKGLKQFLRTTISFLHSKAVSSKPVKIIIHNADKLKLLGPESIYSENYYSKRIKDPYRNETNHIGEILRKEFEPESVIDFGCAIGTYLEPFYEKDIDINGIDANKNAFKHAVVPKKFLEHYDLREKYETKEKFDLVLSIEVAEHIPEKYAKTLVESLCDASKKHIVLTAAPPGQGGTHHVNEKPREYWIDIFEEKGFKYKQYRVDKLRDKIDVDSINHIEKNIFVFSKNDSK